MKKIITGILMIFLFALIVYVGVSVTNDMKKVDESSSSAKEIQKLIVVTFLETTYIIDQPTGDIYSTKGTDLQKRISLDTPIISAQNHNNMLEILVKKSPGYELLTYDPIALTQTTRIDIPISPLLLTRRGSDDHDYLLGSMLIFNGSLKIDLSEDIEAQVADISSLAQRDINFSDTELVQISKYSYPSSHHTYNGSCFRYAFPSDKIVEIKTVSCMSGLQTGTINLPRTTSNGTEFDRLFYLEGTNSVAGYQMKNDNTYRLLVFDDNGKIVRVVSVSTKPLLVYNQNGTYFYVSSKAGKIEVHAL